MKVKQCTKCGSEFDARVQFCFRDGTLLKDLDGASIKSEKIAGYDTSANQVDELDIGEISQDISIEDLLDIQGISLGLDIDGIDLNAGGQGFGAALDLPSDLLGEKESKKTQSNFSVDEELGVDFDFENESDSEELGEEITGELDFDEFENTLDLDAELLAQEIEKESVGMVASPLVGMEGLQVPMGSGRIQVDEELLPGDTLDLELDLETLEGLDKLKEEEERKKQIAALTPKEEVVDEVEEEPESSNSKLFIFAIVIGIIGAVAAMSFFGKDKTENLEKKENIELSKEKKPTEIKPKNEAPIKEPEVSIEEVEKKIEPAEEPVKEKTNDEKATKPIDATNTNSPGGMKLPTEKVPDKQKIIPKPNISIPQKKTPKKTVVPKKVTPKKKETPKDDVVKADDGSFGLWGATPVTDCYVIFNSNVSDARVFLNGIGYGKKIGRKIKVECEKKYKVKIQAEGYLSEERDVQSNATKEFFVEMKQ